jgi:hypothetical protein
MGDSIAVGSRDGPKGSNVGIFKTKKQPETGAGAAQMSPEKQEFMRRQMDEMFGPHGPAHLVAYIPDPGVTEPGRVTWMAVPSWDPADVVADAINAEAPAGLHARVADWDVAMPNGLFIHVGDLFASGLCDEGGLSPDGSYALIGVAIGDTWARWHLDYPQPLVPDASDDRIWQTP